MNRYYVKVFTDDSNVKEWEDLTPDKIHHIEFKGKWFDEVRHGKWEDPEDLTCYKCSVCGEYATQEYRLTEIIFWNYCPNCGALMRGEEDANEITE